MDTTLRAEYLFRANRGADEADSAGARVGPTHSVVTAPVAPGWITYASSATVAPGWNQQIAPPDAGHSTEIVVIEFDDECELHFYNQVIPLRKVTGQARGLFVLSGEHDEWDPLPMIPVDLHIHGSNPGQLSVKASWLVIMKPRLYQSG